MNKTQNCIIIFPVVFADKIIRTILVRRLLTSTRRKLKSVLVLFSDLGHLKPPPLRQLSNAHFYAQLSPKELKELSHSAGLTRQDVDCTFDFLEKRHALPEDCSVLEMGAGTGRAAIPTLERLEHSANIKRHRLYLSELAPHFLQILYDTFQSNNNVTILPGSAFNIDEALRVNVVLALWCFPYEFNDQEQTKLMETSSKLLTPGGYGVFDLPSTKHNNTLPTDYSPEKVTYRSQSNIAWFGHIPTIDRLIEKGCAAGLTLVDDGIVTFDTAIEGRERTMLFMKK